MKLFWLYGSQFAQVFAQLHNHLNTMKAVSYVINAIILTYLEISYGHILSV